MAAKLATLDEVAIALLSAFESYLPEEGVALPTASTGGVLAYVTNGPMTAVDGPCLRVALAEIGMGMPGAVVARNQRPGLMLYFATFYVELFRTVPTIADGIATSTLPSRQKIQASSVQLIKDAAGLTLAGRRVRSTFPLTDPGDPLTFLPVLPLSPAGSIAGNRLSVSIQVM